MPIVKGTTIDPARTRAAILAAATGLLYERGLDGIGVAELCRRLGVSKETLYRHFGSKEGLVQEVLEARSDRVTAWMRDAVAAAGEDPTAQLAAVFDALGQWYGEADFRGCAIVNAAVQHHYGEASAVAARHLGRRLDLLTGIATRAGAADPHLLARQLLMLVSGTTVVADMHGVPGTAGQAKLAALALLRAAVSRPAGATGRAGPS